MLERELEKERMRMEGIVNQHKERYVIHTFIHTYMHTYIHTYIHT